MYPIVHNNSVATDNAQERIRRPWSQDMLTDFGQRTKLRSVRSLSATRRQGTPKLFEQIRCIQSELIIILKSGKDAIFSSAPTMSKTELDAGVVYCNRL
jgi:hypothetical protein